MTAALYLPGDWPAMVAQVQTWARSVLAFPVVWAKQRTAGGVGVPVPSARPYATIDLITPPMLYGQAEQRRASGVVVIFDAPGAVGELYSITVDGGNLSVLAPGTTAQGVRDSFLALFVALGDPAYRATSTPGRTDAFTLTPSQPDQRIDVSEGTDNLALKIAAAYFGDHHCTFTAEVVTLWPDSAAQHVSALRLALESDQSLEVLRAGGWAFIDVLGVSERDLSWAGLWEDRSAFDFRLGCRSRRVELIDWIEGAEITGGLAG